MFWILRWILSPFWMLFYDRAESARQATLLWTLAAALERKFPVVPLLEALADEAGGSWRWKVRGLADLISAGVSIPGAIEASGGILRPDAVALIRVGAESGGLLGALREAAELARRRTEAPAFKFQGAMIYLCLVMTVLASVSTFIMIFIIPKYKVIFEGFETKLPAATEALIFLCDGAGALLPLLVPPMIVALWVLLALSLDLIGLGPAWDQRLRLGSRFWPHSRAPHVLRCLGIAVDAATPISTVLNTIVSEHPDPLLRWRLAGVASGVEAGEDCWQSLRAAGFLRWSEAGLLTAAERAGNLGWALRCVADGIERRLEYRYRLLLELVQPVMVAAAGAVVAGFCLSLFLPLISVLDKLS